MFNLKKTNYKYSAYLNDVINIDDRRFITRLRTGCSTLNTHKFLKKSENDWCSMCHKDTENVEHTFLACEERAQGIEYT